MARQIRPGVNGMSRGRAQKGSAAETIASGASQAPASPAPSDAKLGRFGRLLANGHFPMTRQRKRVQFASCHRAYTEGA
jgi:hypothetical protein